jgi:hypothetical protein
MINKNELRLGNWVKWPKDPEPNEVPWQVGHWLGTFEGNYPFPEPIPLTEEWLLKLGFEKGETFDYGISLKHVPMFSKNNIFILLSENVYSYFVRIYDGGTSEDNDKVAEIHFVHQLQNLYFALTGEELMVKP